MQDAVCQHEWVVFSQGKITTWVNVQCARCLDMGSVVDPSDEECRRAQSASVSPYRWSDDTRVKVQVHGQVLRYVIRAAGDKSPSRRPRGEEEVAYLTYPPFVPAKSFERQARREREDMASLASFVEREAIRGKTFAGAVSQREKAGIHTSKALWFLTWRFQLYSSIGDDYEPEVVAHVIRKYAGLI